MSDAGYVTEERPNEMETAPEPDSAVEPVTDTPPPTPAAPPAKTRGAVGLRMRLLQIGTAGLVVGVILVLVSGRPESRTVSEIIEEIHALALSEPQGGMIGKWFVSASALDERNGRLVNFKIEGGPVSFSARNARIIVNPTENTFQFEMWGVVMTRIPDKRGEEIDQGVQELDRYVLGPLPYPVDVVPDAGTNHRLALEVPR